MKWHLNSGLPSPENCNFKGMMQTYFRYKGFVPSDSVKMAAASAILEMMRAKEDTSMIVARAEFDGTEYSCSIDLFDLEGSEYVFVTDENPVQVIHKATNAIQAKIRNRMDPEVPDYMALTKGINPNLIRASSQRSSFGPPSS